MIETAIIGGTGFEQLAELAVVSCDTFTTPYGEPSSQLMSGTLFDKGIVFLSRHGTDHAVAPHKVNYRANIRALKDAGVRRIIALASVGGIRPSLTPGCLVIPDQIIDYTWGREHTFFDGIAEPLDHIEFSLPYSESMRHRLIQAAARGQIKVINGSTYAVTQGPRLETAAEIDRLEKDGADIVGMTGMPEAALARELGIEYASIALVVNAAAGRSEQKITMELIRKNLATATHKVMAILKNVEF